MEQETTTQADVAVRSFERHISPDLTILSRAVEDEDDVFEVTIAAQKEIDGVDLDIPNLVLSRYMKNPVVLFAHDHWSLPIAKTLSIMQESGPPDGLILRARFRFMPEDPFAERVRAAWTSKYLNAASVSWINETDATGEVRSFLTEWSIVPVPADPWALREYAEEYSRSILMIGDPVTQNHVRNSEISTNISEQSQESESIMPEETTVPAVTVDLAELVAIIAARSATTQAALEPAPVTTPVTTPAAVDVAAVIAEATAQATAQVRSNMGDEFKTHLTEFGTQMMKHMQTEFSKRDDEAKAGQERAVAATAQVAADAKAAADAVVAAQRSVQEEADNAAFRVQVIDLARDMVAEGHNLYTSTPGQNIRAAMEVVAEDTRSDDYWFAKLEDASGSRDQAGGQRSQISTATAAADKDRIKAGTRITGGASDRLPPELQPRASTVTAFQEYCERTTNSWKREAINASALNVA